MIYFLSCLLNFGVFHYFLFSLINLRYSKGVTFVLFQVFVVFMTLTMFFNNQHINMVMGTVIRFPYVFLLFQSRIITSIILVTFFVIQNSCVEILVANLLQIVFRSEFVAGNNILFLLGIILSNLCSFLTCYLFAKFYKINHTHNLPKYAYSIFILPITTILLLININSYTTIFQENSGVLIILIGLALSNFITFYIFNKIVVYIHKDEKQKQEKQLVDNKLQITQQLVNIQNKTLHDIRGQSNAMLYLLENKKYDDLQNYLHNTFLRTINLYNGANSNCIELNEALQRYLDKLNERYFELQITLKNTSFPIESKSLSFLFSEVIHMIIKYASEDYQRKTLAVKSNILGKNQLGLSFSFPYLSKDFIADRSSSIIAFCKKNNIMMNIENNNKSNTVIIFFLFIMDK